MLSRDVPEEYAELVRVEREALWRLVEQARAAGESGDREALHELAGRLRSRIRQGDDRAIGNLTPFLGDLTGELDSIYDAAFPVDEPGDITALLAGPWPTTGRRTLLAAMLGRDVRHRMLLDDVAQRAITADDPHLLRALIRTPLGSLLRENVARILDALHSAGALDATVVERAFTDDRYLGHAFTGPDAPACTDAVRDHVDELTWRLIDAPEPAGPDELPQVLAPRGLRFVEKALAWTGDPRVADHLGAAQLTGDEQDILLGLLAGRSVPEQRRAYEWRVRAGDADALLPLFGLDRAAPLWRLIRAMPEHEAVRQDRAVLLAAVEHAGVDAVRRLLKLEPSELVSAVLGDNRGQVLKRVKNHALQGIAAFGMLPLAAGETVLDRYLILRESAKKGAKLGPNRRHSHAAAVEIALDHLAQVAGVAEPSRLEWDCEARLAAETPTEARAGEYRLGLRFEDADPVLTVSREGKPLKSVPATVRTDPAYRQLREHQELVRDQARRMRTGLVERLVATAGTLTADELARLRALPAGAAMLPALLWRDHAGTIGLLDEVDTTRPITAVHPVDLLEQDSLADWQARIVQRRLRQPVKQAFRELYVLTPAERESVDVSLRFAGQTVDGKVAGQLLSTRGWTTGSPYAEQQATRPAGHGLVAALTCDFHGYFGMGDVVVGGVRFLRADLPVPLIDVPPVVFSEVMRDLDLVVSAAGTEPFGSNPAPK
jgi:hypothetical protein